MGAGSWTKSQGMRGWAIPYHSYAVNTRAAVLGSYELNSNGHSLD